MQELLSCLDHFDKSRTKWIEVTGNAETPKTEALQAMNRKPWFAFWRDFPPGCRRVAKALVADDVGPTYPEVAVELGVHIGTINQHLRRIRRKHPEVYAALMKFRARQLAERHRAAIARERERSRLWHRITRGFYFPPFQMTY
ncbi:MAG TPA: hypothetical protein VKU19_20065 [Bryobacteraceae bacterium]|nr:hypothetical protein [Bryobacteraceae bacterium]